MNRNRFEWAISLGLWVFLVCSSLAFAAGSQLYPLPTDWAPSSLASWSQPLVASGPVLPPVASANNGELFMLIATPGAPVFCRKATTSWEILTSSGGTGGSGVASHSQLDQLEFSVSGHTGFASSGALLAFCLTVNFNAHVASQTDPHGASMTVSQKVTIGSGPEDTYVERTATGTLTIASFVVIPPEVATPTNPATFTVWGDANTGKLKCFDGSNWQSLWPTPAN